MTDADISTIKGYHAHVYFDPETKDEAWALREKVEPLFAKAAIGRFHEKPIGPHPQNSFQIAFGPQMFGAVIPWLALNRGSLRIFVHAVTDDAFYDHTALAMWLGDSVPLELSIFEKEA